MWRGVLKHGWKPDSGVLHFYLMIYRWGKQRLNRRNEIVLCLINKLLLL